MKIDALINAAEFGPSKVIIYQPVAPQPEAPKVAVEPRRKSKPMADWSSSTELENLIWAELKIRGNPTEIEKLAAVYENVWLMQCARKAIVQFKQGGMSWDGLMFLIEQLAAPLEEEAAAPLEEEAEEDATS